MSSGSRSLDNFVTVPSSGCGATWTGTKGSRSWNGTNTPHGQILRWNGYTLSNVITKNPLISWSTKSAPTTIKSGTVETCGMAGSYVTDPWTANDDLEIVNRLRAKVIGSDINLAVAVSQAPQAANMILHSASRIAKAVKCMKSGNLPGAYYSVFGKPGKPKSKKAGDAWLEMQYGWLPLLSDAKSGAELLAAQLDAASVSRHKVRMTRKQVLEDQNGGTSLPFRTRSAVRRKQYIAEITDPTVYSNLGLLDPEEILWELKPWSFVIDWFVPIGAYFQARNFARRLQGRFLISTSLKQDIRNIRSGGVYLIHSGGKGYVKETYSFSRTITTSLPVPMLPSFVPPSEALSYKRMLNSLALLNQLR